MLMPTVGLSIILHAGSGEPNLLTWTDRPANAVMGRWDTTASFVVVSPKWIITTRHQGTSPATVVVNDVIYNCIYNTTYWTGGPAGNADIRLIRLKNTDGSDPNLAYAPPYTNTDEVTNNICIGGYGQYRGNTLYFDMKDYGYSWTGSSNNILRWGQNIIDGTTASQHVLSYYSDTLYADFDKTGTDYEAAPAMWDSGGGWFINQGGTWKLAALSAYVTRTGETWYDDPNEKWINLDFFWGIRVSSYSTWINEIIAADCNGAGPVQGDLNGDCKVDFFDFAAFANQWLRTDCGSENNFCDGADFEPHNGNVDFLDAAILADNWLEDKSL